MKLSDALRIVCDHYRMTDDERAEIAAAVRRDREAAADSYVAQARAICPAFGINERLRERTRVD